MLTRIITGVVLAPLVILLFTIGPEWARVGVLIAAAGLCLSELLAMVMPDRPIDRYAGVAIGAGVLVAMYLVPHQTTGAWALALIAPALLVVARPEPIEKSGVRLLTLWASFAYIVVPFFYALLLASHPLPLLLFSLGVVWLGDTGAYFAGRFLGNHKLHPRVSPKKTWEGAIGGLIASVGLGILLAKLLGITAHYETLELALFALIGGLVGQLGDLAESLIKRTFGVKDSGTLLPGHGGMLDRLDGCIFALPVFAYFFGL